MTAPLVRADARVVVYVEVPTVRDSTLIGTGWHVLRRFAGATYGHCPTIVSGDMVAADDYAIDDMQSLARLVMRPIKFEWPEGSVDVLDPTDGPKVRIYSCDAAMRRALSQSDELSPHLGLRAADTAAAAGRHNDAMEWIRGLVATLLARGGARLERDELALREGLRRCK